MENLSGRGGSDQTGELGNRKPNIQLIMVCLLT